MPAPAPLMLYSANTWLAFSIAETFFGGAHYVWCTPYFDARRHAPSGATVPPTSNPAEIYLGLYEEVKRGDRHSAKIKENKLGILRGARLKRQGGVITEKQNGEITTILKLAETKDFRPLIYVMPYAVVAHRVTEVAVHKRAHPLAMEYIIDALPRNEFEVIEPLG